MCPAGNTEVFYLNFFLHFEQYFSYMYKTTAGIPPPVTRQKVGRAGWGGHTRPLDRHVAARKRHTRVVPTRGIPRCVSGLSVVTEQFFGSKKQP